MRKVLLVGGVIAIGLSSWGIAQAGSGANSAPGAPQIVHATSGGMPPTSQVFYAVVNGDGTLARSFPKNVTVSGAGTGNKVVHFTNRNVRGCAYTGTIGLSGASGTSAPGFITTVGAAINTNGVFVTTDDTSGASADLGFHLQVAC